MYGLNVSGDTKEFEFSTKKDRLTAAAFSHYAMYKAYMKGAELNQGWLSGGICESFKEMANNEYQKYIRYQEMLLSGDY